MLYFIQNMMCKPVIGGKGADGRIGIALTTTDLKFVVKYKAINQALSKKLANEQTQNQQQIQFGI
jgi:hypothetical protein